MFGDNFFQRMSKNFEALAKKRSEENAPDIIQSHEEVVKLADKVTEFEESSNFDPVADK